MIFEEVGMKDIHLKFVVEVRKGATPEAAAEKLGFPAEKGRRWMQKRSIREAIEAPVLKTSDEEPPRTDRGSEPKHAKPKSTRVTRKK